MSGKWTGKKAHVSFLKPKEPAFLKDFKKRIGYEDKSTKVEDKVSLEWEPNLFPTPRLIFKIHF